LWPPRTNRSPDGRWLVYSGEGISVRTLPVGEQVQKISDVGTEPKWCQTCNEIVFRNGNRWFSSEVREGSTFDWKPPRMILQTSFNDSPDRHLICLPTVNESSS
jgi:hypothetical protein